VVYGPCADDGSKILRANWSLYLPAFPIRSEHFALYSVLQKLTTKDVSSSTHDLIRFEQRSSTNLLQRGHVRFSGSGDPWLPLVLAANGTNTFLSKQKNLGNGCVGKSTSSSK